MVSVPLRGPVAAGENVTLMLQLEPDAKDPPQLFETLKSPVAVIELIVNVALPELRIVTLWLPLVVLITWLGKVNDVVDNVTEGVASEELVEPELFAEPLPLPQPVWRSIAAKNIRGSK